MGTARAVSALAVVAAIAGCTAIRPLDAPRDAAAVDVPAVDVGIDGAALDADVRDAGVDAPSDVDASIDAAALPDVGTDASQDAAMPDVGSDAGASGCADGTDDLAYLGVAMVGCDGSTTQCEAATLCAPGWHLCTYSEYALRGGATVSADSDRWIASCVRDGPTCALFAMPTEAVCSDCARLSGSVVAVGQLCGASGTGTRSAAACPLGMTSSTTQLRTLSESACLYASSRPVDRLNGATCCR